MSETPTGPHGAPKKPLPAAAPTPARPAAARPAAPVPAAAKPAAPAPRAKPAGAAAAKPAAAAQPKATPSAPAAPDPLVGKVLGRVKLLERIGQGRTATVYKGVNTATDGIVAVKVLTPQARQNAEIVSKFAREARAIARIDNENVLKIFDVGQEGEEQFLVMELLDGEEILDLLQREGRMEPTDALRVVRQSANGLAAAHAQGIIHRDVKPQNLVLLEDGTVKVVDFGLAAGMDSESQRVGTPHYMAPETCEKGVSEPASDVYSLGITLYHLLIGQPPYAGQSVKEILASHVTGEPLKPERRMASLKREIGELVRSMTKRDPLLRPSMLDVMVELDKIGGQDLRKKDALRGRSPRFRASAQARASSKSSGTLLLIVVGIVVVVGAILALSGGGKGGGTEPTPETPPTRTPGSTGKGPETNVPLPPVETPEQKAAREKREAELAKSKTEAEAKGALTGVETWIRSNWHSKSDDSAVVARYKHHAKQYAGTEAAKESERRVKEIGAGKMHPHPDKSFGAADAVETVRAAWAEAKPKVEEAIARFDYATARGLVPEAVQDAEGSLALDLAFWTMLTEHLKSLQQEMVTGVEKLEPEQRTFKVPGGGTARVKRVGITTFELQEGTASRNAAWTDVPVEEIARLAKQALTAKGTRGSLLRLAFAWAHRVDDAFWEADLELGMAPDLASYDRDVQALKRTIEERMAKR